MKHLALAILISSLFFGNSASADDAAKAEAGKLLDAINMDASLNQTINIMLDAELKQNPNIVPYKNVMLEFISKYMSYEALKPRLVELYSTEFSASELRQLRMFYSTPVGQKYIARLPTLISKGAELGGKSVQDHLPELEQMIENEMERLKNVKNDSSSVEDHSISDGTNICWQSLGSNENDTVCQNEAAKSDYETCKEQVKQANSKTDLKSLESSKAFEQCMRDNDWFIKIRRVKF